MADAREIARRQAQALEDRAVLLKRRAENLKYQSDPNNADLIECQVRADAIYNEFGSAAPSPLRGEDVDSYQLRIVDELKQHSPKHRDMSLRTLTNLPDRARIKIEEEILSDAQKVANNWAPPGQLREKTTANPVSGGKITEFVGDSTLNWMDRFMTPGKRFVGFKPGSGVNYQPFIIRGNR